MAPAAPATNPGHGESSSGGRRRRAPRTVSRRALLQLLIGVLVVATIPLDRRLAARLRRSAGKSRTDRLMIVRERTVVGTRQHVQLRGHTVVLDKKSYRGLLTRIPNAVGISLFALRPDEAIEANV